MEATLPAQVPENIAICQPSGTPAAKRPRSPTAFTLANAAEMARRGNEAKKQREVERQAKLVAYAELAAVPDEEYRLNRLQNVRAQITSVEALMRDEDDAQTLDRLASAMARLSDIEQKLAGRPSPGSLRPKSSKSESKPASIEPL